MQQAMGLCTKSDKLMVIIMGLASSTIRYYKSSSIQNFICYHLFIFIQLFIYSFATASAIYTIVLKCGHTVVEACCCDIDGGRLWVLIAGVQECRNLLLGHIAIPNTLLIRYLHTHNILDQIYQSMSGRAPQIADVASSCWWMRL